MSVINAIENKYKKPHVVDVRSGDTVRVHQKIREGNKERVQVFEGLVIKTSRKNSLSSTITVRRIASGVGVEKTYLVHNPLITKIEVVKRSKVRRNYLSYMRSRTGKSARLASVDFNQDEVNKIPEEPAEQEKPAEKAADTSEHNQEDESDKKEQKKPQSDDKPAEPADEADKKEEPKTDSSDKQS